jgi:hypothetical protein
MGLRYRIGAGLLGVGLVALAQPAAAQSNAAPTFAKDIAPIFQEKCQVCHRPGSIGPMSLLTYEAARPWARSIKSRVVSRDMPPWHLDKTVGIQKFINDRSLSDTEIDTIVRWVDAGAPRGNAADMPPAKQWPAEDKFQLEASLGPPDLIVKAKAWTIPAAGGPADRRTPLGSSGRDEAVAQGSPDRASLVDLSDPTRGRRGHRSRTRHSRRPARRRHRPGGSGRSRQQSVWRS